MASPGRSDPEANSTETDGHHDHSFGFMGKFGRFLVRYPIPMAGVPLVMALIMAAVGMSQFSISTDPPKGRSAFATDTGEPFESCLPLPCLFKNVSANTCNV
jgi:hypothetical protein